jgi:hypothetical protein
MAGHASPGGTPAGKRGGLAKVRQVAQLVGTSWVIQAMSYQESRQAASIVIDTKEFREERS